MAAMKIRPYELSAMRRSFPCHNGLQPDACDIGLLRAQLVRCQNGNVRYVSAARKMPQEHKPGISNIMAPLRFG